MTQDGLVFDQLSDTVLEVRDTISNRQYRIESSESLEVEPTEYDNFPGPVTHTVVLDAVDFEFPEFYSATVRDADGDAVANLDISGGFYTSDRGTTIVELHTAVKTYLRIDGQFECISADEELTFDLAESTSVILGARMWQCYPNTTITVSNSLTDLREAISHFGNEIMTTSPERSFPTLRGHPPRLSISKSLDIPDSLSKPESGLTVTIPRSRSALLAAAPLAYYLLATIEFDTEFTVRTADGFTYCPPHEDITDAVQSVLTRCFALDCIVRTEGLYPLDLQERREFESRLNTNFDFATLYEQSLPARTESYFQVDLEVVREIMSDWPTTAIIKPETAATEALPYLVYELAHIKPADPPRYTGEAARQRALEVFTQRANETRSTSLVFNKEEEFVDVPETESQQTIWVGEGIPLNASKFALDGYENQAVVDEKLGSKTEDSSSGLEITVVCNDLTMAEEPAEIEKGWDPRDDFPMELTMYSRVSTDQFRRILESGTDYLHFIGHATPDGLKCVDGLLNVETIEESNVETFFLNACQSYQQGKGLVERGSGGGIVTYSDVADTFALRLGTLIARLLNAGFPIGPALDIVQKTTPVGSSYTTVGSPAAKIIQPQAAPYLREIIPHDEKFEINITFVAAGQPESLIGGVASYSWAPEDRYYLVPSSNKLLVTREELNEVISMRETPVVYKGDLLTKAEFFDAVDE